MKYMLYDTAQEYKEMLEKINKLRGYPKENTESYFDFVPPEDINGNYVMPVADDLLHLFNESELVDSVEYNNELDEDLLN